MLFSSTSVFASTELGFNKAIADYSREDYNSAITLLEEIVSKDPNDAKANHLLGLSYYKTKDYDQSLKFLKIAQSLDPGINNIHLDLGSSYLKSGDRESALSQFEAAVSANPDSGIAYYNKGYANFLLGNYNEAVVSLNKAKVLNPKLSNKADYYAGISNFRLNQYNSSKENFEFVLKSNPDRNITKSVEDYLDVINSYNKKFYGTLTAGVQYDSNVSLEPEDVNIFTDENDFSGIFFVNLGYKPLLREDAEFGFDYKGFLSLHFDITDFNIQNHRFTVFGEKKYENGFQIFADYYYELVFIGDSTVDELFSQTHSFKPGIAYNWNDYTSTQFLYNLKYRDFDDFPERDSFNHRWALSQTFRLFSGRLFLVPGAAFSLNAAADVAGVRNYDYYSPEAFFDMLALMNHGISVFANVYYYYQDYYNDDFGREDNQLGARAILSKKIYDGVSLDFGYQYILNNSDSSFPGFEPFDYRRHIFTTALSYRF